jgi:putative heme iron utilization protein
VPSVGREVVIGTEPTDAELGRTLLCGSRIGALSTTTSEGFPFGSLVAYAVDDVGRPLLCLSDLAEHSRNLTADPRASLLAAATGDGDPLALARITVLGTVVALHDAERDAALRTYRDAHPDAFYYSAFADFRMYRMEVESVRYVGGFGRMSWVSAADHAAAGPDPRP